jgi:hypothetical protein
MQQAMFFKDIIISDNRFCPFKTCAAMLFERGYFVDCGSTALISQKTNSRSEDVVMLAPCHISSHAASQAAA